MDINVYTGTGLANNQPTEEAALDAALKGAQQAITNVVAFVVIPADATHSLSHNVRRNNDGTYDCSIIITCFVHTR